MTTIQASDGPKIVTWVSADDPISALGLTELLENQAPISLAAGPRDPSARVGVFAVGRFGPSSHSRLERVVRCRLPVVMLARWIDERILPTLANCRVVDLLYRGTSSGTDVADAVVAAVTTLRRTLPDAYRLFTKLSARAETTELSPAGQQILQLVAEGMSTRTTIITGLPSPNALAEIDATAVV